MGMTLLKSNLVSSPSSVATRFSISSVVPEKLTLLWHQLGIMLSPVGLHTLAYFQYHPNVSVYLDVDKHLGQSTYVQ